VAGAGFEEFFSRHDWDWRSAHEFRQRHVTGMLLAMLKRG
jgi:hypothetical protein